MIDAAPPRGKDMIRALTMLDPSTALIIVDVQRGIIDLLATRSAQA